MTDDVETVVLLSQQNPDDRIRVKVDLDELDETSAEAKANAAQGLPELIITATNMEHTDNSKAKHKKDAKYGWYKYESRFALPVFAGDGEVERYNVFHVAMILRHDKDGKKYLYDIMNIKKETSDLFQSEDLTQ